MVGTHRRIVHQKLDGRLLFPESVPETFEGALAALPGGVFGASEDIRDVGEREALRKAQFQDFAVSGLEQIHQVRDATTRGAGFLGCGIRSIAFELLHFAAAAALDIVTAVSQNGVKPGPE